MPTLFDRLLGSWDLVSYQLELDSGRIIHPLGEDAIGLIVYTPQRRMSVNIMRPGRAPWESPNPAAGTGSEIADAAAGYLAYGGSFAVDESLSVVEHYVDASLFPNWIGEVQKRFVDLTGEELLLESPVITDAAGTSVTPRLRWRRIT